RPRKHPPPAQPPPPPPPKPQKPVASPPTKTGPDFSLPPTHPLLQPRPPIPPPPPPGPSKPTDVADDFSKSRVPSQVTVTTFYTSIEPWLRNIREEDVGFLEHTADELDPYVLPALGRHYLDVWDDQDAARAPAAADPRSFAAPLAKWDPSTLGEGDLAAEDHGHGPLTERVISALLPIADSGWKGVKAAEDAMEGRPGGSGAAAARKERLNVSELEVRIRDTMRYHGLLDGVPPQPEYTDKVDDPIATALRHAQRELRRVVATNKARRARLAGVARDRLGYQEYLELRDSLDRNIANLYAKLQRKDTPKVLKRKKQKGDAPGSGSGSGSASGDAGGDATVAPGPCPAALGFHVDEEMRLRVNEQLAQLVDTRRQWVDTVGAVFEAKQREQPGRIWGFPEESVFRGIEEEVGEALAVQGAAVADDGKGKGRARAEDAMDVG
ncbi:hypothetical protein C0993_005128, partial [Termitomyces sp. T159_Od127]